jgi:uncharacterized protein (TIGR04222 family)
VFDPYELAYLRGGKHAVIRTVLYALHHLGLLEEVLPGEGSTPMRLVAKTGAHPARPLSELEERVLGALRSPVVPSSLFRRNLLNVESLCDRFRHRLESEELLRSADARASATRIPLVASGVLALLSLYKIILAEGRPFMLLVGVTIVALFILWKMVGAVAAAPVSARGKAYLERLRDAYRDMPRPAAAAGTATSSEPDMSVALVGLFGIGILSGTSDAAFATLFSAVSSGGGSSTGWAGGWGSDWGGGSSSGCGAGGCGG